MSWMWNLRGEESQITSRFWPLQKERCLLRWKRHERGSCLGGKDQMYSLDVLNMRCLLRYLNVDVELGRQESSSGEKSGLEK